MDKAQHYYAAIADCYHNWIGANTNARHKPGDPQLWYSICPCPSYTVHPAGEYNGWTGEPLADDSTC